MQIRPVGDSAPERRKAKVCPHLGWPRRDGHATGKKVSLKLPVQGGAESQGRPRSQELRGLNPGHEEGFSVPLGKNRLLGGTGHTGWNPQEACTPLFRGVKASALVKGLWGAY